MVHLFWLCSFIQRLVWAGIALVFLLASDAEILGGASRGAESGALSGPASERTDPFAFALALGAGFGAKKKSQSLSKISSSLRFQ